MVATLLIEQELLTGSTTGSASASGYTMTSAQNPQLWVSLVRVPIDRT